jgi:hypothetical protein
MKAQNNLARAFLYLLIVYAFSFNKVSGQLSNYLYGIRADSAAYYFSRIDVNNNHTQNLSLLSLPHSLNSTISTCTDFINDVYYISDYGIFTGYNALDGSIISRDSIPGMIWFGLTAFNSCDTSIYGFTDSFTKYNISTRTFSTISSLPSQYMCAGCLSVIDPENNIFIYQAPDSLKGLSLVTGEKIFSTAILEPVGEGFGHISYDCSSHKVFGLSWDNTFTKYLSTIDPLTGIVSHVSETGWTSGFWKPLFGGDCIDQNSEFFTMLVILY